MQRQVCQFVPKHLSRITGVGAGATSLHNDALFRRHRDSSAVFRRVRADQLSKSPPIWRDEDEHATLRSRKPGKAVSRDGEREQRTGERGVVRRGTNSEATLLESLQAERKL